MDCVNSISLDNFISNMKLTANCSLATWYELWYRIYAQEDDYWSLSVNWFEVWSCRCPG